MKKYYLTIDGVPYGKPYFNEEQVKKSYLQLTHCVMGLGWTEV